ncbi:hypothetical protein N752_05675 [Desulforamulus aquiferis]|nr:hypothetical protein N752_05675 [Desulforamulus aquiferis]
MTITFLMTPTEGTAVNLKFLKSIKTFIVGKVQTAHLSFTNKEKHATDYISAEVHSVLKNVPYDILLPLDKMDIYKLEKADVNGIGDSRQIDLVFRGTDNELITITQVNVIEDVYQGNSYDTEDATMKKANIKGQEANLIVYKNGFSKLSWVDRDILISIAGKISEDDILILASSTKRINYSKG